MKTKISDKSLSEVGDRLNALASALSKSDAEMARRIRISPQRWNNYAQGRRPVSVDVAVRLADAFSISLDWLYRGVRTAMPYELMVAIEKQGRPRRTT